MKHKLIIFDWDGTLMDSVGQIVSSIQVSARLANLPVPSMDEAKDVIGLSLGPAIKQLFNFTSDKEVQNLISLYQEAYKDAPKLQSPLFNGATELLTSLKGQGRYLAVATGKGRLGLHSAWEQSKTRHFFDSSRCADDAQSKPSPDMLMQILDEMNIAPEQAMMVGDSCYDMAMAQAIDMDRVGVSHGVHSPERLSEHKPLGVIDKLSQLHDYL